MLAAAWRLIRGLFAFCVIALTVANLIQIKSQASVPEGNISSSLKVEKNKSSTTDWLSIDPLQNVTRRILFVHVGKAGGESIKQILTAGCSVMRNKNRRKTCLAALPNSTLSNRVAGYFHCFSVQPKRMESRSTSFLFNLRHPVDRALSWYKYVHPDNCHREVDNGSPACSAKMEINNEPEGMVKEFFMDCFPKPSDWADAIRGANTRSNSCIQLGQRVLNGNADWKQFRLATHMVANLQHYANRTVDMFPEKEVFVARTNLLWDDLRTIDILLGGNGDFGSMNGTKFTHGSEHSVLSTSLSSSAMFQLCCGLLSELVTFKSILNAAVNLPPETKAITWQETLTQCGRANWEELVSDCPS